MEKYPQVLVNVRVSTFGKARFADDPEIKNAIERSENMLGDEGRILVRVSGTEPLIRVMVEGKDNDLIKKIAEDIANVVKVRLI